MPKKQFLVSKVTTDRDVTGVQVDGQEMKFSKSGESFYLSDAGKARELDATLGAGASRDSRQVVISEVPMAKTDGVHNYTFTIKKPKDLESNGESNWVWVDNGKGKQVLVKREDK